MTREGPVDDAPREDVEREAGVVEGDLLGPVEVHEAEVAPVALLEVGVAAPGAPHQLHPVKAQSSRQQLKEAPSSHSFVHRGLCRLEHLNESGVDPLVA